MAATPTEVTVGRIRTALRMIGQEHELNDQGIVHFYGDCDHAAGPVIGYITFGEVPPFLRIRARLSVRYEVADVGVIDSALVRAQLAGSWLSGYHSAPGFLPNSEFIVMAAACVPLAVGASSAQLRAWFDRALTDLRVFLLKVHHELAAHSLPEARIVDEELEAWLRSG